MMPTHRIFAVWPLKPSAVLLLAWICALPVHATMLGVNHSLGPTSMEVIERRAILSRATNQDKANSSTGQGIVTFLTAAGTALALFAVQLFLFALFRNKLARIFKPKTYLVPERERTDPPPRNFFAMIRTVITFKDREIINKCGLDAYFFLRYLKTLLIIFVPICGIVLPILIPINYINGIGKDVNGSQSDAQKRATSDGTVQGNVTGLDTLAWGNIRKDHTSRYAAHLLMAILVVIWVCTVFFYELKAYIKVRQDYLTSAEHRLRASATTVLVNAIPEKWLTEEALFGLFDVFPGGVRNIWINRDLTKLLDKISMRDNVHSKLENAETELIKAVKKAHLKQKKTEERQHRKQHKLKAVTRKERAVQDAQQDAEAKQMAESGKGDGAGDKDEVPHTIADEVSGSGIDDANAVVHDGGNVEGQHSHNLPQLGFSAIKMGKGALNLTGKAGKELDGTLKTTNGFMAISERDSLPSKDRHGSAPTDAEHFDLETAQSRPDTDHSTGSTSAMQKKEAHGLSGNTVRKLDNADDLYQLEDPKFWQFWKIPAGGYSSPVPQGSVGDDFNAPPKPKKPFWKAIKSSLPFMGEDEEVIEYQPAFDTDAVKGRGQDAVWPQYIKEKDRPTHRLSLFGVSWLFGLPFVTKKVDTIYWCREELARLNLEIEEDQKHPERYPFMNSAFVQFNHQIAAHMACQSLVHHVPRQMAPRISEVSPRDVIWGNMAMTWWQQWLRSGAVIIIVIAMIILWGIPVAATAALSQVDQIIKTASWLGWLRKNEHVENFAKAIAGVLPAAIVGILLSLVPLILALLAGLKGVKTRSEKNEFVQRFYFIFLFVQLFLVVSIASFFTTSLNDLIDKLKELQDVQSVLFLLADNLPKAANYFFSYMILQAFSVSSGTLLQIGSLFMWFIMAPLFDSTARNKWRRNTNLNSINWGSFFPIYTNFACIALIYCVIAPLISIFAVITFGLLWMAQRYSMVYIYRFETDTGGVLYPRAINQAFTGLYFMEACMAGLFYITVDGSGSHTCTTHGTIMIVVLILTIIYQLLLHFSFSPLFRYLPVTIEDEAVLRDEAFQRAQDARLGLLQDDKLNDAEDTFRRDASLSPVRSGEHGVELDEMNNSQQNEVGLLSESVKHMSTWARQGGKQVGGWAKEGGTQIMKLAFMDRDSTAAEYRRQQRKKDLESQRAMGDALYGGIHDEIEDLTPSERDVLVKHAFVHYGLRARRPTVWIPRDDIGVSEDEIRQTERFSKHIWISNEGTALDSKQRVVYGKNPPDFSELDVINL